jgi:hypothetical protein
MYYSNCSGLLCRFEMRWLFTGQSILVLIFPQMYRYLSSWICTTRTMSEGTRSSLRMIMLRKGCRTMNWEAMHREVPGGLRHFLKVKEGDVVGICALNSVYSFDRNCRSDLSSWPVANWGGSCSTHPYCDVGWGNSSVHLEPQHNTSWAKKIAASSVHTAQARKCSIAWISVGPTS